MKTTLRTAVFLLLATSALTVPSRAEDVPPVVAAIFKNWDAQLKTTPTYDKIETDGSGNVTITNLAATVGTQDPTSQVKLSIASVKLENVAAEADGLIDVGTATFTGTKVDVAGIENQSFSVEIPQSSLQDWYVAVVNDAPTPLQAFRATMGIAKKITSGEIKVTAMGQSLSAAGVDTTWAGDPVTGAGKTTMSLKDFVIPEAALALMDPTGQLKQLGYTDLTFNVTGDGEMTVSGDNFGMSGNVGLSGKDLGEIKVAYGALDIPVAVMAALQAAQKAGTPPDFNALMPQLMNVALNNVQIRFEDASITKKLLPIIAKQSGMDEATMVASAGAMAQVGLMQLKNQAFTDQVVKSINAFLADPKSFTVNVKPAAPVKVQQIMTLDPANPGAAIDVLGVSVTAND